MVDHCILLQYWVFPGKHIGCRMFCRRIVPIILGMILKLYVVFVIVVFVTPHNEKQRCNNNNNEFLSNIVLLSLLKEMMIMMIK